VRKSEAQLNWEQKSFAVLVVMPLAMEEGPGRKYKQLPCAGGSQMNLSTSGINLVNIFKKKKLVTNT